MREAHGALALSPRMMLRAAYARVDNVCAAMMRGCESDAVRCCARGSSSSSRCRDARRCAIAALRATCAARVAVRRYASAFMDVAEAPYAPRRGDATQKALLRTYRVVARLPARLCYAMSARSAGGVSAATTRRYSAGAAFIMLPPRRVTMRSRRVTRSVICARAARARLCATRTLHADHVSLDAMLYADCCRHGMFSALQDMMPRHIRSCSCHAPATRRMLRYAAAPLRFTPLIVSPLLFCYAFRRYMSPFSMPPAAAAPRALFRHDDCRAADACRFTAHSDAPLRHAATIFYDTPLFRR